MDLPASSNIPIEKAPTSSNWVNILLGIVVAGIVVFFVILGAILFFKPKTTSPQQATTQQPQLATAAVPTTISGIINFDGYAPSGASIVLSQRSSTGHDVFAPFATVPAENGVSWQWNGAFQGSSYEIQASLLVNGKMQDLSDILIVAAPASSQTIRVESTLPSPPKPAAINGIVAIDGYVPPNTTIDIMAKKDGALDFVPIATGLTAVDKVSWAWSGAVTGTQYEIRAYLQQGGVTLVKSDKIVVTAPGANEVISLNSTLTPPAPAQVSVSGTIQLNGTIPSGSTLAVAYRPTGTTNFTTFVSNLSPQNNATWSFNSALSGSSYDLQAILTQGSTIVAQSQIQSIVAPAANEVLTINAPLIPAAPVGANTLTNTCVGLNTSSNLWQTRITVNNNNVIPNMQQYRLTIGTSTGGTQVYDNTNSVINTGPQTVTTGFVLTAGQTYYAQWSYATCSNCSTFSGFSQSMQFSCQ